MGIHELTIRNLRRLAVSAVAGFAFSTLAESVVDANNAAVRPAQQSAVKEAASCPAIPLERVVSPAERRRFLESVRTKAVKNQERTSTNLSSSGKTEFTSQLANRVKQSRILLAISRATIQADGDLKIKFPEKSMASWLESYPAQDSLSEMERKEAEIRVRELWAREPGKPAAPSPGAGTAEVDVYRRKLWNAVQDFKQRIQQQAKAEYFESLTKPPVTAFVTKDGANNADLMDARLAYAKTLKNNVTTLKNLDLNDDKAAGLLSYGKEIQATLEEHPELCKAYQSALFHFERSEKIRQGVNEAIPKFATAGCLTLTFWNPTLAPGCISAVVGGLQIKTIDQNQERAIAMAKVREGCAHKGDANCVGGLANDSAKIAANGLGAKATAVAASMPMIPGAQPTKAALAEMAERFAKTRAMVQAEAGAALRADEQQIVAKFAYAKSLPVSVQENASTRAGIFSNNAKFLTESLRNQYSQGKSIGEYTTNLIGFRANAKFEAMIADYGGMKTVGGQTANGVKTGPPHITNDFLAKIEKDSVDKMAELSWALERRRPFQEIDAMMNEIADQQAMLRYSKYVRDLK